MPVLMSFCQSDVRVCTYRNRNPEFHFEMNTRTDAGTWNAQARQFLRYCNGRGLPDRGWRFPCDSHGNARCSGAGNLLLSQTASYRVSAPSSCAKAVKTGEILVDLITTTQDWKCAGAGAGQACKIGCIAGKRGEIHIDG